MCRCGLSQFLRRDRRACAHPGGLCSLRGPFCYGYDRAAFFGAPQTAGSLGRRYRRGGRAEFGRPDVSGRTGIRVFHLPEEICPQPAGEASRRDGRSRGTSGLCPDPFHPRAAHPAREGDIEHLHQSNSLCPGGNGFYGHSWQERDAPPGRGQCLPGARGPRASGKGCGAGACLYRPLF